MTIPAYIGLYALVLNIGVAVIATLLIRAFGMATLTDATVATDYEE
jgi:SSS family solute:Na+ symporter